MARSGDYKKQAVASPKTKIHSAITRYKVIQGWNNFSLVELQPQTGRTHQIRVHLHHLGNPLVGDKLYRLKKYVHLSSAPRHLLHAFSLEFKLFNQKYSFQIPLPNDMKKFLDSFKHNI